MPWFSWVRNIFCYRYTEILFFVLFGLEKNLLFYVLKNFSGPVFFYLCASE